MLLTEYDEQKFLEQEREVWKEEGREEGLTIGRTEGQARVNQLIQHLLCTSRGSEIERVVTDLAYQEQLLKEFGL